MPRPLAAIILAAGLGTRMRSERAKVLHEIAGEFGFRPEDREPAMPEYLQPNEPLFVVVAVREEEVEGTKFQAGFYRATIRPHHAMRHCGVGLSDILGGPRSDSE